MSPFPACGAGSAQRRALPTRPRIHADSCLTLRIWAEPPICPNAPDLRSSNDARCVGDHPLGLPVGDLLVAHRHQGVAHPNGLAHAACVPTASALLGRLLAEGVLRVSVLTVGTRDWTETVGAELIGRRPFVAQRRKNPAFGPPSKVEHVQFDLRQWDGPISGDWYEHFGKGKQQVHSLDATAPLRSCNEVETAVDLREARDHASVPVQPLAVIPEPGGRGCAACRERHRSGSSRSTLGSDSGSVPGRVECPMSSPGTTLSRFDQPSLLSARVRKRGSTRLKRIGCGLLAEQACDSLRSLFRFAPSRTSSAPMTRS